MAITNDVYLTVQEPLPYPWPCPPDLRPDCTGTTPPHPLLVTGLCTENNIRMAFVLEKHIKWFNTEGRKRNVRKYFQNRKIVSKIGPGSKDFESQHGFNSQKNT